MSAQHTPGPWFVFKAGVGEAGGAAVASIWRDGAERDANAQLIAAAPALLEEHEIRASDLFMLRKAVEAGDPKEELLFLIDDMLRETKVIIAKARGETPEGNAVMGVR